MAMHQAIQDLKDGATYVDASGAYEAVTDWVCNNGGAFCYHFETGEAFAFDGRVVEVFGL